jgi:cobalt-zinc-cadmium efflux system protein
LALAATWIARRPATTRHTYGYHRVEVLAALVNAGALIVVALLIVWEAWERLGLPREVQAPLLIAVASGGLVVNLLGLWILHGGREMNLNVRAAWWHVLGDALGSVQAVIAGVLILMLGWTWADAVASMLIASLVVYASWSLVREGVMVLMEGAPGHIDVEAVRNRLMQIPGVAGVHDLHVWTIASGLVALSAHVAADRPAADVLRQLRHDLRDEFGIAHTTIEFDPPDGSGGCQLPL